MSHPIRLNIGADCKEILGHMYDFGQEFYERKHEKPLLTPSIRRTLDGYMYRDFHRGEDHWTAWAYHTTKGVTVCARKVK